MRAVIDTNIWLRALISPHATPAKVLEAYRAGRFTVVASLPLLEELEDVLCRPEITHKMLAHLFLIEIGNPQRPGRRRNQGKWTWAALGVEFKGIRRCLQHEPGRLYSLQSEGGIESRWTYRAEPEGDATRLTLDLEYQVPERARSIVPTGAAAEAMRKAEADRAVQNLKIILDR